MPALRSLTLGFAAAAIWPLYLVLVAQMLPGSGPGRVAWEFWHPRSRPAWRW